MLTHLFLGLFLSQPAADAESLIRLLEGGTAVEEVVRAAGCPDLESLEAYLVPPLPSDPFLVLSTPFAQAGLRPRDGVKTPLPAEARGLVVNPLLGLSFFAPSLINTPPFTPTLRIHSFWGSGLDLWAGMPGGSDWLGDRYFGGSFGWPGLDGRLLVPGVERRSPGPALDTRPAVAPEQAPPGRVTVPRMRALDVPGREVVERARQPAPRSR